MKNRTGWYYQQLLKLYAQQVIPDLSDEVLILDSDTIFLRETEFFDKRGRVFMTVGSEYHNPYFAHGQRLLPGWRRVYKEYSGISNHMMFNRNILQEIFSVVEGRFHRPFWEIFLQMVDSREIAHSGASEFELYFNYCFDKYPDRYAFRKLLWDNATRLEDIEMLRSKGVYFVSCHAWQRGKDY
jgi:hypothetical protein